MKRTLCLLLILCLCLSGCGQEPQQKQYNATFLTLFDTVTTVVGRAASEEEFKAKAQIVHDELEKYHQLFDIYNDYAGVNNLKTVNDQAGIAPVTVDPVVIDLLKDCKTYYKATFGTVNVAMGSVLALWHDARDHGFNDPVNAALPDEEKLREAALHTDISRVIIDEAASTVYLEDPDMRLDVGAVAKGWATQKVTQWLIDNGHTQYLISVGGNVCATGPKDAQGTAWVVGVQDPQGGDAYLHTLYLTKGSIVTSGDYQRAYMVEGKLYHHIIDPSTLYPGSLWRAVTVVCEDSGLADALSTALFLLPQAEGQLLLERFGAEALWVDSSNAMTYSPGFRALIRT